MTSIKLSNKIYNNKSLPYIIAEIGVNHNGSLDKAKLLIKSAKEAGADGVKFQTYKAEKIASKDSPSYWDLNMEPCKNQYELFKKYDSFTDEDYMACYEYAKYLNIDFLSTPFDAEAVEFLDPLVPFHKIASADITNIPLLRHIAGKSKPVIISTGASTLEEIELAMFELSKHGAKEIILLHCILNYPTQFSNANLNMINSLQASFPEIHVGISDHTLADKEMLSMTTAYTMGARVIEKHFTDDKTIKGGDHLHSMDKEDLLTLKKNISFVNSLFGSNIKKPLESEGKSRKNARRSIVISNNVKKGAKLAEIDLTYKRPASGISTLYWDDVIGRVTNKDLDFDHILQWNDLL